MAGERYVVRQCPACLAPLPEVGGSASVTCEWCGTTVRVEREEDRRADPETDSQGRALLRDASGRTLLRAKVPRGWSYAVGTDSALASDAFPFGIRAEFRFGEASIRYRSPATYEVHRGSNIAEFPDKELPAGSLLERPSALLDHEAALLVGEDSGTLLLDECLDFTENNLKLTKEMHEKWAAEIERANAQAAPGDARTTLNAGIVQHMTSNYRFQRGGRAWMASIHLQLAIKNFTTYSKPILAPSFSGAGLGGLAQQLGSRMGRQVPAWGGFDAAAGSGLLGSLVDSGLVGGVIGQRVREQRLRQASTAPGPDLRHQQAAVPESRRDLRDAPPGADPSLDASLTDPDARVAAAANAGAGAPGWQAIEWLVMQVSSLVAPADEFRELFEGPFTELVYSVIVDDSVMQQVQQWRGERKRQTDARFQQRMASQQQMVGQIVDNMNRQTQIQAQNALAQNEAMLARARATNAAIDANNDAFRAGVQHRLDLGNAQHDAFRARQAAQFGTTPGYGTSVGGPGAGGMSPAARFSQEGILEQSTYVDQWGDTHTVSSHADAAWIDGQGNVIGTDSWVDPGSDWTRMRKL